jgi:hypothetical protein
VSSRPAKTPSNAIPNSVVLNSKDSVDPLALLISGMAARAKRNKPAFDDEDLEESEIKQNIPPLAKKAKVRAISHFGVIIETEQGFSRLLQGLDCYLLGQRNLPTLFIIDPPPHGLYRRQSPQSKAEVKQ